MKIIKGSVDMAEMLSKNNENNKIQKNSKSEVVKKQKDLITAMGLI